MAVNNNLVSVIPTLYAQGLMALRSLLVMPRLVTNDFGSEVRQKGETIQIPLPSVMSAVPVVPAAYAPDPQNIAPTTASIPLDSWYESAFTLTEKEVAQIIDGIVPIQLSAAVQALAFTINGSIMNNYNSVFGFTGTPGTTPFASAITPATTAGTILTQQYAPLADRRLVLDPVSYGTAVGLPNFSYYLYSGDREAVDKGAIKEKFGFDWYQDQQVPVHVAGTITGTLAAQAATNQPVGSTSIVATTAASSSCALLAGDIISFAGDSQTYVLTANATQAAASSNVTLQISPAKLVALVGGEAITVQPTHRVNLAFHKQAFGFASRPLMNDNIGADPERQMMVPDPVSGVTMRMIVREEFHRTRVAFDVLWGTAPIRPALAARIAG